MTETRQVRTVVVDDDDDARFLIRRALERSGRCTVVGEASDGTEAVHVSETAQPDLVVLDLNMPGVDGLTALPAVRAVCNSEAVIVVISAQPTPELSRKVADEGGSGFIAKDPGYSRLVADLLALVEDALPSDPSEVPTARWQLPADPSSGSRARRRLRGLLGGWHLPHLFDDAALVATELVNNAVVHARSSVTMTVERHGDAVRIAVTDTGSGTPRRPETQLDDTHGRGLMLVAALAANWGTAVNGAAKTVWVDLAGT